MSTRLPLTNKTILVTRPEGLANSLIQQINDAGGIALHYPVIQIGDSDKTEEQNNIIDKLSTFDIAIFISPTAVQKTLAKIKNPPEQLVLAVIGRSTEAMLNKHGLQAQIVPEDFNTESLLEHPNLQQDKITNTSIVIFRGVGGRELLGNTLIERGAKVVYAEMYQRRKNSINSLSQKELTGIDMLTVTSNEGLQNLYDLTDDKSALTALPIVVPGTRAHKLATQLGFSSIIQSSNATDDACLLSLNHFWSTNT